MELKIGVCDFYLKRARPGEEESKMCVFPRKFSEGDVVVRVGSPARGGGQST